MKDIPISDMSISISLIGEVGKAKNHAFWRRVLRIIGGLQIKIWG